MRGVKEEKKRKPLSKVSNNTIRDVVRSIRFGDFEFEHVRADLLGREGRYNLRSREISRQRGCIQAREIIINTQKICIQHLRKVFTIYTSYTLDSASHAHTKIEARSQALVVATELTRSMIICVFFVAEIDKVDNKSNFMQLKTIYYTYA